MRHISDLTRRFLTLILATTIALASLVFLVPQNLVNAQTTRDCDSNAVIECGALTIDELKLKYINNSGNIQAIYRHFGINSVDDFNGMVLGSVTTSNQVLFANKVIATNAITAGRQNMPGSTRILNGLAFERPPSVSFASSPLSAFIKMKGNQFQFAVITSCGNPVIAKPVIQPQPKPIPKVPNFTITKTVSKHGANQFGKSVTVRSGQLVDFKIVIVNTGQIKLTELMVSDDLPMDLIPTDNSLNSRADTGVSRSNSIDLTGNSGTIASTDTSTSINSSSSTKISMSDLSNIFTSFTTRDVLLVGKTITITYSARISKNIDACDNPLVNKVTAQANETNEKSSQASVRVCNVVKTVTTVTPAPTPAQPVAVETAPLINTGTGAAGLLGIFGLVTAGAAMWHSMTLRLLRKFGLWL